MRIEIIDGFRGFFLINMAILHCNSVVQSFLVKFNHHKIGWVEDAQGFVFLSGLVIGLVFGKKLLRSSLDATKTKIRNRIRVIYRHHAFLILLIAYFSIFSPFRALEIEALQGTSEWLFTLLSLSMLTGPKFIDILPMYIAFMLFTPAILVMLAKGRYVEVLSGSFAVWVFAQTGIPDQLFGFVSDMSGLREQGVELGLYFNRFGWQIIYFWGLAIGMKMAEGTLDLSALKSANGYKLFLICLGLFVLFSITRAEYFISRLFPITEFDSTQEILYAREALSPLRLMNFAVDLYLITWLLVAGATQRATKGVSDALRWVMTCRPLVFLGQHSLQVYTFHVIFYYVTAFYFSHYFEGASEFLRLGVIALSVCSLYVVAAAHKWHEGRKRAHAALVVNHT